MIRYRGKFFGGLLVGKEFCGNILISLRTSMRALALVCELVLERPKSSPLLEYTLFLFVLIQEGIPWCVMFADDFELIDYTKEDWKVRWNYGDKLWNLPALGWVKTEYIECKFCVVRNREARAINLDEEFQYLGSSYSHLGLRTCHWQ